MHTITARTFPLLLSLLFLGVCLGADEQIENTSHRRERAAIGAWYTGEIEDAITIYERLLADNPSDAALRLDLLVLLREAGELERALTVANDLPHEYLAEKVMTGVLAGYQSNAETDGEEAGSEEYDARYAFWRAMDEYLHGSSRRAESLLEEVVATTVHYPYAYLFRGIIARDRGDWDAAIGNLTRALRQDANLTHAFLPLAEARFARGERREAYDLIGRAAIALPWNEEIRTLRAAWEDERPELVAGGEAAAERRRLIAEPPVVAPTAFEREAIPYVRIGLVEGLSSVHLKTGGPFRVVAVPEDLVYYRPDERLEIVDEALAGPPLAYGERGTILRVEYDPIDGTLVMQALSEGTGKTERVVLVRAHGPVRIVYEDPSDTTIVFDLAYGHGQFSAGREDRSYRGDVEFIAGVSQGPAERFTLVNAVNIEEYLYSVVPSEMPAWWPEAALEAQAVAARSYTLHRRTRFHARGFDLASSVASAYYRGVSGEHPRTTAAVDATRALVLSDGRGTLDAVYSANAAGYTESSESVWGFATSLVHAADPQLPPLEPQRSPGTVYRWLLDRPESYSGDPAFAANSAYRWTLLVAREDIERRLAAGGSQIGRIRRIIPGRRGVTGRLESVRIVGTEGEAVVHRDSIRSRLGGLRSNLFVVTPQLDGDGVPQHFYFKGAGWGHGVGMCQTGAAGMAADGFSVAKILNHYYPRNELVEWY